VRFLDQQERYDACTEQGDIWCGRAYSSSLLHAKFLRGRSRMVGIGPFKILNFVQFPVHCHRAPICTTFGMIQQTLGLFFHAEFNFDRFRDGSMGPRDCTFSTLGIYSHGTGVPSLEQFIRNCQSLNDDTRPVLSACHFAAFIQQVKHASNSLQFLHDIFRRPYPQSCTTVDPTHGSGRVGSGPHGSDGKI